MAKIRAGTPYFSNAAMMLLGLCYVEITVGVSDALSRSSCALISLSTLAASFVTNTNWQAYSGESSLSNLSQMMVITFLMCISATTGVAACGGFIRPVLVEKKVLMLVTIRSTLPACFTVFATTVLYYVPDLYLAGKCRRR